MDSSARNPRSDGAAGSNNKGPDTPTIILSRPPGRRRPADADDTTTAKGTHSPHLVGTPIAPNLVAATVAVAAADTNAIDDLKEEADNIRNDAGEEEAAQIRAELKYGSVVRSHTDGAAPAAAKGLREGLIGVDGRGNGEVKASSSTTGKIMLGAAVVEGGGGVVAEKDAVAGAADAEVAAAGKAVVVGSSPAASSSPPTTKAKKKNALAAGGYVAYNPDGSALVLVRPPPLSPVKRLQKIQTVAEITAIVSEDFGDIVFSVVVAGMLLGTAYFMLRRLAVRSGVPEVLLFLFSGMLLRLVSSPLSAARFDLIAKPFVRMALTAMGLQIGSHLNKGVIDPLLRPLIRFSCVFVPVVIVSSTAVTAMLFPQEGVAPFALLVGAIALERSSPEALHGIAVAKAQGPFTNSTMAIAALQDVFALVCFVVFGAIVGYPLVHAIGHLTELTVGTMVATGITILGVRAAVAVPMIANLFAVFGGDGSGGHHHKGLPAAVTLTASATTAGATAVTIPTGADGVSNENDADGDGGSSLSPRQPQQQPSTPTSQKTESPAMRARRLLLTRVLLAFLVFVTPFVSWFFHVELLLAAVIAGAVLNWDQQHRLTAALEAHSTISNIVLFCLLGHRINILAYLQNLPAACVLFTARLVGLWLGAWGGGLVAPLHTDEGTRWHNKSRWMGLVTQLAIALSLVDRMEEDFPQAAAMARACGGSVIGGLLCGPSLLQYVLKSVGEAGKGGGGGSHHGGPATLQQQQQRAGSAANQNNNNTAVINASAATTTTATIRGGVGNSIPTLLPVPPLSTGVSGSTTPAMGPLGASSAASTVGSGGVGVVGGQQQQSGHHHHQRTMSGLGLKQ